MNLTGVQACTVHMWQPSIAVHPGFLLVYTMSKTYLGLHLNVPVSKRGQLHHVSDPSRKRSERSCLAQAAVGRQSEAVGQGSENVGKSRKRLFSRVLSEVDPSNTLEHCLATTGALTLCCVAGSARQAALPSKNTFGQPALEQIMRWG